MTRRFTRIDQANKLPDAWDQLAENHFQRRRFLQYAEMHNPCQQRYYTLSEETTVIAAAVVYSLRMDLLTYLKLKSPIQTHIIGVPCSVSSAGIFGKEKDIESLLNHIYNREKGFVLGLNLRKQPDNENLAKGSTLPTIVFNNVFNSWEHYVNTLRSDYRRRFLKLSTEKKDLSIRKESCSSFSNKHYEQYLEVFKRSKGKLECLSYDFFKNLPKNYELNSCAYKDELLGWNIALADKDCYYFFLGGIDYLKNEQHHTYFRLLYRLLRDGIESGYQKIDLGQTAETPKLRTGAKAEPLFMAARHSNPLIHRLLKRFSGMLEYNETLEEVHVIKEESL